MACIFYQTLNFSLKNSLKTGVICKKNYSVICSSSKLYNCYHVKNKHIEDSQHRQFSFKSTVSDCFSVFDQIQQSEGCIFLKDLLIKAQESTGLPWWATIILASSAVRFGIILPAVIYKEILGVKYVVKLQDCQKKLRVVDKAAFFLAKKNNLPLEKAIDLIQVTNSKLIKDMRYWKLASRSVSGVVSGLQTCIWIGLTGSLRSLTSVEEPELVNQLSQGGILSFYNLLIPDSHFVLPIIFGVSSLVLIEFVYLKHIKTQGSAVTIAARIFAVSAAAVSAVMPSGVTLYWTTSVMGALVQNIVVVCPRLLRICKIENLIHGTINPYKVIWERFKFMRGLKYDKEIIKNNR